MFAAILAAAAGKPRRAYLEAANFNDFDVAPGSAQVTAQITAGGVVNELDSMGTTAKFTWLLRGAGADYEVMAELNSGTEPLGDDLDTWLSLSSTRAWITSQSGTGATSCSLHISIRSASSGAIITEASWGLTATVSAP